MKKMLHTVAAAALLATTALAGAAHAEGEKFVWISHGPDSDSWFNVIKNAIKVTNEQMGVETEYRNPPTGDLADMARIVQQASAAGVDGIIVTIADYNVLEGPIKDAVAKGIPVVTVNSGTVEESQKLGALMHVGQPEYEAGLGAGKRAKEAGISSFLCVNHYITNPASVERCRGFADALGVDLGSQMIDSGIDPSEVQNKVKAYLTANPDTGAILTLGPNSAEPSIRAVKDMGLDGEIYFGTFDLSSEISAGIKDGTINFAIDQQPFLQGSVPIQVLTNYVRYGVAPANSIFTGPGFVTKDNIELVESLAGEFR
ncbi:MULTISPECIES: sugar ABC transporter substrate-binding protein [Gemmobacter]|jgi:simple sugar transport system substrate-binding protein|uniref:Sugar ABC transporter substrate-binding protein n=1 Tax=Gemmobacter nanjingensis TaxID=488454 RepID=A0ABQ3FSJ5_9RHOB|nr:MULTISPECIES: sugar ABC transporter substrate-binding protein [Gemmobacter]OJY30983.1 MAG: sugar ABC transporter substrate-binding protein [Rhodobacterales bacterium 65-51]GHC35629.1 sugar ABC transporter substrate-binding protein [Gemmobacter nanjingensis]